MAVMTSETNVIRYRNFSVQLLIGTILWCPLVS